jgi:uncharacterized protein (DUF488 family)
MMSVASPLLITIGYGQRSINEVIDLLAQHGIRFLVDVRSVPWSRYQPDFSRNMLEECLATHDIVYVSLGEELGGRPKDVNCYDSKGRVNYEACRQRPVFRHGIGRLRAAWEQGQRVALLCSEVRPQNCHRSKLLGAALLDAGIEVMHLDETDTIVSQREVMDRLLGGQLTLFDDPPPAKVTRSRGRRLVDR